MVAVANLWRLHSINRPSVELETLDYTNVKQSALRRSELWPFLVKGNFKPWLAFEPSETLPGAIPHPRRKLSGVQLTSKTPALP